MKSEDGGLLVGVQTPRIRVTPEVPANDAADLVELAAAYGLVLDPWQVGVFEAGLGVDSAGKWASDTVVTTAPRQSGKGACIEALLLASIFLFNEQTVACSAHEARTTRLSFERFLGYVDGFDDLRAKVASVQRWVGREQIRFKSGQLIVFPARSRGALRGYSIDRLILDEAQYLTQAQLEAVLPTMSARNNSQSSLFGTPPTHLGDGEVLTRLRAQALSGRSERLTWLEWSAEPGCDLDDRQQWAQANPALGGRISIEAVMAERAALSDEGFRRERLGVFDVDQREHVFGGADVWPSLAVGRRNDLDRVTAIGVDRSPDGLVCVTAAYRDFTTGTTHIEPCFVGDGVPNMAPVVEWITSNTRRPIPVVVDGQSTAATAISMLQAARRNVIVTHAGEMARACIALTDDVLSGVVTHADSPNGDLARAVDGARRRPVGDAGGYAWDRRDGTVAVSPLVAASLALYGAVAHGRPPRKPARVVVL